MEELFNKLSSSARIDKSKRTKKRERSRLQTTITKEQHDTKGSFDDDNDQEDARTGRSSADASVILGGPKTWH